MKLSFFSHQQLVLVRRPVSTGWRFLILLLALFIGITSYGQTTTASDNIVARKSFNLSTTPVDSLSNDSMFINPRNKSLVSMRAIWLYFERRQLEKLNAVDTVGRWQDQGRYQVDHSWVNDTIQRTIYSDSSFKDDTLRLLTINNVTIQQFITILQYLDSISRKDTSFWEDPLRIFPDSLSGNDTIRIRTFDATHRGVVPAVTPDHSQVLWDDGWGLAPSGATGGGSGHVYAGLWLANVNDSTLKADSAAMAAYFLRRADSSLYTTRTQNSLKADQQALVDTAEAIRSSISVNGWIKRPKVVWLHDYVYNVSPGIFQLDNITYNTPSTDVTLAAADVTDERTDNIVVTTSGTVVVITGTPSTPAVDPGYDANAQMLVASITVPANSTAPTVVNYWLYLNNAEWTTAASAGTIALASTNNTYAGSTDIEGTNVANGQYFTLTSIIPPNMGSVTDLIFEIRSKANWSTTKKWIIRFYNGTTAIGNAVTFGSGSYGFVSTNTTQYQTIDVSLLDFGNVSGATALRITQSNSSGTIGWYLDNIQLQGTTGGGTPPFVTNVSRSRDSVYVTVNGIKIFAFIDSTGGAGTWGTIGGTLSSQTDLQTALNAKQGIPVKQSHTSGATVTVSNTTTWLVVNPASLLASLTITMPASPTDAQTVVISFGGTISSGITVTALTISPNTAQTVLQNTTPSSVDAGESVSYKYNSSNTTWYRIN